LTKFKDDEKDVFFALYKQQEKPFLREEKAIQTEKKLF
jgi:hypothetical protein